MTLDASVAICRMRPLLRAFRGYASAIMLLESYRYGCVQRARLWTRWSLLRVWPAWHWGTLGWIELSLLPHTALRIVCQTWLERRWCFTSHADETWIIFCQSVVWANSPPLLNQSFSPRPPNSYHLQPAMLDSEEEDYECPLCMEELDIADRNFRPCTCGYQVCEHSTWCACKETITDPSLQDLQILLAPH